MDAAKVRNSDATAHASTEEGFLKLIVFSRVVLRGIEPQQLSTRKFSERQSSLQEWSLEKSEKGREITREELHERDYTIWNSR